MTFNDYLEKQDHIVIRYHFYSGKPYKRFLSLDGIDLKDIENIFFLKYDTEKDELLLHREGGPAYIEYYESGNVKVESWYQNNKRYRLDGPADISYYKNGTVEKEIWFFSGKLHRLDGPAVSSYYQDGTLRFETFYNFGNIVEHIES